MSFDKFLVRCSLPVRDIALSSNGKWCAVSSDELVVKIVSTEDTTSVMFLREQLKPVKHVSFDPSCKYIALSCTRIESMVRRPTARRIESFLPTTVRANPLFRSRA